MLIFYTYEHLKLQLNSAELSMKKSNFGTRMRKMWPNGLSRCRYKHFRYTSQHDDFNCKVQRNCEIMDLLFMVSRRKEISFSTVYISILVDIKQACTRKGFKR